MNRGQRKIDTRIRPTPTQIYHRIYKDVDYQTNPYVIKVQKKCPVAQRTKPVSFCRHHKVEESSGSKKSTKSKCVSNEKPKLWNRELSYASSRKIKSAGNNPIKGTSPKIVTAKQMRTYERETEISENINLSSEKVKHNSEPQLQDGNRVDYDEKVSSAMEDDLETIVSSTTPAARKAWNEDIIGEDHDEYAGDEECSDGNNDHFQHDESICGDKCDEDENDKEIFQTSIEKLDDKGENADNNNERLKITEVDWHPIEEELQDLQIEDVESNSDDYDTDIEEAFPEEPQKEFDPTGEQTYREQCQQYKIIPVRRFIDQLPDEDMKLRFRGMSQNSSKAISEALLHNYRVQRLDLSNNNLGSVGGSILIEILRENAFLTKLDLSENQLGADVGCQIAEMLSINSGITKLYLRGNKFTDRVAKAFAETLKVNATLKHLDLSYNEFNEQGALFLGAGLALNKGVVNLNLRWNSIRSKGGVSLAAALSKNSTLKELDLSWNGLTFIGCLALGRHLKKNKSLEALDISNNRIGQDGPTKLSGAISHHPCLRIFKIGWNPLGDVGVQTILKAAGKSPSIEYLSFEKITITKATQSMIDQLQASRNITIATGGLGGLSKGKLPPGNMDRLVQHIQDNRMRLTDIFFQIDKDRNNRITKEEFVKGLSQSGLKMDKVQISNLIDQLDTNNDGDIEFSEILFGQRTIMNERRFQKKVEIQTEKREAASIRLPKIKGF